MFKFGMHEETALVEVWTIHLTTRMLFVDMTPSLYATSLNCSTLEYQLTGQVYLMMRQYVFFPFRRGTERDLMDSLYSLTRRLFFSSKHHSTIANWNDP